MEHRLNTDNAWVEAQAINFHDEYNLVFSKVDVDAVQDHAVNAKWLPISKVLRVPNEHLDLLKSVCRDPKPNLFDVLTNELA